MSNPIDAFTSSAFFDAGLWFVVLYDKVYDLFDYEFPNDGKLDPEKIDFELIKHLFTNVIRVRRYEECNIKEQTEVEKSMSYVDKTLFEDLRSNEQYLTIAADNKVIVVKTNGISIYHYGENSEYLKKLAESIYNILPKKEKDKRIPKINLIKCSQGDYYTVENDIRPTTINLDENYNDDFKPVYNDIKKFLEERCSGLVLLHGDAGTGKTSLIRHLITNVDKDYVIVPNSIASRLGDPDLVSFIVDNTDSVFILEDCEQLLEDREENSFNNAITTILNMSDGLLSDVCNIKFICTFNAQIGKIDKALLRKGRCAAKYKFDKLSVDKVRVLNEKYNLGHKKIEAMTLAEVYNSDKPDYTEKKTEKLGF